MLKFTTTIAALLVLAGSAAAQRRDDSYRPPADQNSGWQNPAPANQGSQPPAEQGYQPPADGYGQKTYGQPQTYGQSQTYGGQGNPPAPPSQAAPYGNQPYGTQANNGYGPGPRADDSYRAQQGPQGYGAPYSAPPPPQDQGPPRYEQRGDDHPTRGYYSKGEISEKGRGFFGSITQGLASAIEYTYAQNGRPNGYILGEDGGGAFFAGLRYGEGTLYTKDAGDHRVFWQGPSLGWDVGGEGSKIMVLVYNMADPGDIYHRFGGVEGSVYVVGGVSVQFQKRDDVTLAVIRSGVGLRLGANVGYLKYSRSPTWNPF
jgi:hypothetical protein